MTKSSGMSLALTLLLTVAAAGCDEPSNAESKRAPQEASPESAQQASQDARAHAPAAPAARQVAKVVFVGKKDACDCTRRAIATGWAALGEALGEPAELPVERLQSDSDGAAVAPYRRQRPMLALPAIYFVDQQGQVLELLQGEVSADQVKVALGR